MALEIEIVYVMVKIAIVYNEVKHPKVLHVDPIVS